MPYFQANGVKIHYMQIDNRINNEGPDLVMIHGLATSMAFWYFQHGLSLSKTYRVTLYDLRGHGRSGITADGYTPHDMSIDLRLLLDHLGISRSHFIAHSFGGAVALNLACQDPARFDNLILVDSHITAVRRRLNHYCWTYGEKIQPLLKKYGLELDIREPYFGYKLLSAAAGLYKNNVKIDKDLEKILYPTFNHLNKRSAYQWLSLLESTKAGKELMGDDGLSLDSLTKLKFPILAMYGEHSQAMSTGDQLLQVWPHAQFYKMYDAGHFFPVTRPKKFLNHCRRFLANTVAEVNFRTGDGAKRYFRSDRFRTFDGVTWFVYTRGAEQKGPFHSFNDARVYLMTHLPSYCATGVVKQPKVGKQFSPENRGDYSTPYNSLRQR